MVGWNRLVFIGEKPCVFFLLPCFSSYISHWIFERKPQKGLKIKIWFQQGLNIKIWFQEIPLWFGGEKGMTEISGRHCSSQGCTKEDPLYTTSTSTNTQGPLIFKRPGGKKTVYTKCIYIYVYICVYIHMLCKIDVYFTACKSCVQNLFRLFLAHFFPSSRYHSSLFFVDSHCSCASLSSYPHPPGIH